MERLGLLRVRGDAIFLRAMRWPDEIRSPQELAADTVEVSEDEIEDAQALIDHMTRDSLEGREFVDHYTDALAEVIKAKREGHALPAAPEAAAPAGQVVDLMSALEASVQKARASRGKDGDNKVSWLPHNRTSPPIRPGFPAEQHRGAAASTARAATSHPQGASPATEYTFALNALVPGGKQGYLPPGARNVVVPVRPRRACQVRPVRDLRGSRERRRRRRRSR